MACTPSEVSGQPVHQPSLVSLWWGPLYIKDPKLLCAVSEDLYQSVHMLAAGWSELLLQAHDFEGICCALAQIQMSRLVTKPTKWSLRPAKTLIRLGGCPGWSESSLGAKTQISLGIHPVWSESSLSAWRNIGSSATHRVHSEDYDQTGRMPRLIWVFAGRTDHFVGFVMRQLKYISEIY